MRKFLLFGILVLAVSLTSCQKTWERWSKQAQFTDRNYTVEQYSGGRLVATYTFRGTLNDAEGSDGYYFFKGDTLIEITGDLVIKSTN